MSSGCAVATPTSRRLEVVDIAVEFTRRGIHLPEDLLERIDNLYMRGFKDGLERGMYEQMTMEDV